MPNLLRALWCPRNDGEVSHQVFRLYSEEITKSMWIFQKAFRYSWSYQSLDLASCQNKPTQTRRSKASKFRGMRASASLKLWQVLGGRLLKTFGQPDFNDGLARHAESIGFLIQ